MRSTLWLDSRRPWPDLLARARRAEQQGWDGIRVSGDAWSIVGALAVAVPRIRLEMVVEPGDVHPAVLTKLACTVDQLSTGRLLLGLTPGDGGEERLAEAIKVVKCLAHDERPSFRGEFYRLDDAPMLPKPRQQPFPVMLVAGTPTLAARSADHWSIPGTPEEVRASVTALDRACAESGRDRSELTVSAWTEGPSSQEEYARSGIDEWVVRDRGRNGSKLDM